MRYKWVKNNKFMKHEAISPAHSLFSIEVIHRVRVEVKPKYVRGSDGYGSSLTVGVQ